MKYKISYSGELRTQIEHEGSGERIQTDAPKDNNGEGRYFSPTDLVAASLVSCMITIIGITARTHDVTLHEIEATVEKIMASGPRRIAEVLVELRIKSNATERQRSILQEAARNCPVAKSLHPELRQHVSFVFT